MLPPSPKIFHGRDTELNAVVTSLLQDSARIAILGMGGMGKTTLAIAAVQNAQVESKYSQRYFVSCQPTPTCLELASMIADHLGLEKRSNLSRTIIHHLTHAPPSLLVLDNFETPWEPSSSRSEVEEFLSLLTDIPQLALVVGMVPNGKMSTYNEKLDYNARGRATNKSQVDTAIPISPHPTSPISRSSDIF
jgi:GTPase SAR1 family protein